MFQDHVNVAEFQIMHMIRVVCIPWVVSEADFWTTEQISADKRKLEEKCTVQV